MKFRSLPYCKPLKDQQLQASLSTLFSNYITQSEKLAHLESTQGNESFNNTVASKAPKTRHYGSSGSLGYRVAASVVQKNKGHKYRVDANRTAGLSPGVHTSKVSTLRDLQYKKRKAIAITKKAKLRRLELKTERRDNIQLMLMIFYQDSCEVREGISYQSGIDMDEFRLGPENITEIPPPRTSRIESLTQA
ncbi:unnamed protein product [Mytilus coruscus]|uniref:Uncharacterized protein n=1 Tax=Mytilus coruscus TaxID=42192 RepID=A0A6J8DJ87_MYTCO|nr:unnamed protein product [Mytilus coruscus]